MTLVTLVTFASSTWKMQAEYLFFYIPTIIILGLCIPAGAQMPGFQGSLVS